MLSPHRTLSQQKNIRSPLFEHELISELYKQEIAFKSFVSSLSKCHNRYLPQNLNPQQKGPSSFMVPKLQENIQFNDKSFFNEKIEMIQKIKNSEDTPLVNFRITKSKFNQKSKNSQPYKSKSSRVYKSQMKSDIKSHTNFIQQSPSKNTSRSNQPSTMFYQSPKNHSPILHDIKTKSRSFVSQTIPKLSLQKTSCVSWNPDSKQFISSLFQSSRQSLQSNFLVNLLNVNVRGTINFLFQQNDVVSKFNQVEAKSICGFFDSILQINQIKPLQAPLIKKYSNCIFYGQKPNFISSHAGIIIYFNGNSYFGSLFNFQKHGLGIEFVRSQRLKQKKTSNQQNEAIENFTIYQGNYEKNSKTGSFRVNASNYIYEGLLLNGLFEGQGTLITSKSTFKGKWEKNKKLHGLQVFNKEQMTYEGSYSEDKFHGFGKLRKKYEFYEGQFSNGFKNGKGVLVNQQYIFGGSFKYDLKHGSGTYFDKSQYKQKNKDLNEQNYDFKQCIYYAQFNENKMVSKVYMKERTLSKESLKTFEDGKSDQQTLTLDLESLQPSKLLQNGQSDRLHERQLKVRETFQRFQRSKKILTVIPSEPEQQFPFNNRVNSYLNGNRNFRSPRKLF